MSTATPDLVDETKVDELTKPTTPWKTLLWNDDVNTFTYVIRVLMRVLEKPEEVCEQLTIDVDRDGKAVVFSGSKDEAQEKATQLTAATLWATIEKGD